MSPRPLVVYPLLAAIYPILALAAQNLGDGVIATDAIVPLLLVTALATLAWLASRLLSPDPHVRALLTFLAMVWFGGFGLARDLAAAVVGNEVRVDAAMLLAGPVVVASVAVWARRTRPGLAPVTRYLNATLAVLVLFPVSSAGWHLLGRTADPRVDTGTSLAGAGGSPGQDMPDIYLLVMDAYSSSTLLQERYGFDNAAFEGELEARGFVIPRASRANYNATFLSLTAMLNWRYLDDIAVEQGARSRDRRPVYRLLENNRAVAWLQELGYTFAFFGSAYPPLRGNRNADIGRRGDPGAEFRVAWLRSTALVAALRARCSLVECSSPVLPFTPEGASLHDRKFEAVAAVGPEDGPLFVMAHFLVPHEPMVYDEACAPRDPWWPGIMDEAEEERLLREYPEQVACVNRRLLELVDRILRDADVPPIILIQSDHGLGGFPFGRPPALQETTPVQVRDRTHLFAAYHLPGGVGAEVYDSITPVNVFPLIFRRYFGADVPSLPDRVYWSNWERPYDFQALP